VETKIIDIERAAATHWRGTEEERLGGWLLRAAEGFTGRANSALPLRMKVLMSARSQAFVSVRDDGKAIAVGRLSVSDGWAGITSVEVDPACRRRGLGTAITLGICAEAVARGADRVFLQVETENSPAKSLYERCGFTYSHRYHYRLAPA
jgi:ribosomal protein S18 acetylase RimI-like enzyme